MNNECFFNIIITCILRILARRLSAYLTKNTKFPYSHFYKAYRLTTIMLAYYIDRVKCYLLTNGFR